MNNSDTLPLKQKNDNSNRNYQIDVLKMILSVLVAVSHAKAILPTETSDIIIQKIYSFGWMSVHIFFLISGFLMVKSILKRNYDRDHIGKNAIDFVINKFKPIALPFWISNAIYAFMYIAYYIYVCICNDSAKIIAFQNAHGEHFKSPLHYIINLISEVFCITNVGGMRFNWSNIANWYVCAMLFVMIPLAIF